MEFNVHLLNNITISVLLRDLLSCRNIGIVALYPGGRKVYIDRPELEKEAEGNGEESDKIEKSAKECVDPTVREAKTNEPRY